MSGDYDNNMGAFLHDVALPFRNALEYVQLVDDDFRRLCVVGLVAECCVLKCVHTIPPSLGPAFASCCSRQFRTFILLQVLQQQQVRRHVSLGLIPQAVSLCVCFMKQASWNETIVCASSSIACEMHSLACARLQRRLGLRCCGVVVRALVVWAS